MRLKNVWTFDYLYYLLAKFNQFRESFAVTLKLTSPKLFDETLLKLTAFIEI